MAAAGLALTSCNDYLDKLPDNRMQLKNPSEISSLLVSAYADAHPVYLLEMYSDNTDCIDNTGWTELDRFQRQAYQWDDITEIDAYESPQNLWNGYYRAIASANAALAEIERLGGASAGAYSAQRGEALLCRAYHMFVLSTVFCDAYDETTAGQKLGLPYPEAPETAVGARYERGTLADVYRKIDADIQQALPLVTNAYDHPKYHFNADAAYAFAARFYLYYHKYDLAVNYATKALGANPTDKLRDWASWYTLSANQQVQPQAYTSTDEKANFLLQAVQSEFGVACGPYSAGERYTCGEYLAATETLKASGPWGSTTNFYFKAFSNSAMASYFLRKVPYLFEYSDVQANIGYPHAIYSVFNGDETLMVRAEAHALQGNYQDAVNDLNTELARISRGATALTLESIAAFYNGVEYYTPTEPTVKKKFNTTFAIEPEVQEPLLQCVLHLRRLVTLHEGLRMQDVKRYGMEIYRRTINKNKDVVAVTDEMPVNDPRRAVQLPQDVISAGLAANPRN